MNAPRPLVVAIHAVLLAGFAGDALPAVNTAGLVYTPITPCRIVDTRVTGGPFAAKETRTFFTNGAATQGGGACTVYSGTVPASLSINVTVDATSLGSPSQYGFLNVTPTAGPGSSWMNFVGGQTIANAGVATINQTDGTFAIKTQNPANVIVDVFGYYSAAPAKRAFLSSTTMQGNFGGSIAADGICQGLANAAGLGGMFKAWISDSPSVSPANRFAASKTGYALVDGTAVANSWSDLTDGTLLHAINVTESGGSQASTLAWTGTAKDGTYYDALQGLCNSGGVSWLSNSSGLFGSAGSDQSASNSWSFLGLGNCAASNAFYCFEQ